MTLTVGPSGRIASRAIAKSSGNADLDREVDAMMAAVQAPPPPDGGFHATVGIHFSLEP